MTGSGRPVSQPLSTRARTADALRPADADSFIVNLPGSFPAVAARSGGRIARGLVVDTPWGREIGRPRAAQFAPRAVYIPGGGTRWRREGARDGGR